MPRLTLATSAMSSKYKTDYGYEDPCSLPSMDNQVVLHIGHAPDLLRVLLRLLWFLRDQLLQMLVSLVQLGLEVVDVALSSDQHVLGVLQSGAGVIEEARLHIAAAVGPHQLVIQFLDARFQAVVLLKKLAVTLLDVLD
jgi:hypothetical protein